MDLLFFNRCVSNGFRFGSSCFWCTSTVVTGNLY